MIWIFLNEYNYCLPSNLRRNLWYNFRTFVLCNILGNSAVKPTEQKRFSVNAVPSTLFFPKHPFPVISSLIKVVITFQFFSLPYIQCPVEISGFMGMFNPSLTCFTPTATSLIQDTLVHTQLSLPFRLSVVAHLKFLYIGTLPNET